MSREPMDRGRVLPSKSSAPGASREHGRPISELVRSIERDNPELVRKRGVSSAALRAGDMIRAMRKNAKLSQAALAKSIDVTQARISELESGAGTQGPTWDVMERVAETCGATMGWLVVGAPSASSGAGRVVEALAAHGLPETSMRLTEIDGTTCVAIAEGEEGASVIVQQVAEACG